jgi:PAS domain S-box-containing protein
LAFTGGDNLGGKRFGSPLDLETYANRALESQEQFFAPLFTSPGVGVAVFDDNFRFEAVNDALAAINELSIDAHLGKAPREILGPFSEQVEPYFNQVLFTGKAVIFETKGLLPKREKPGHWILTYIPMRYADNEIAKVCAFVLEVTEKKKLDEALFGLMGKLFYLRNNLQRSLVELTKLVRCESEADIDLLRSLELVEECTMDIAEVLRTIQPTIAPAAGANYQSARSRLPMPPASPCSWLNESIHPKLLSPREEEVLHLLASNKTNKEVAARLGISVRTVESHRRRIMEKLGIHSLSELVHYAIRQRIVEA